MTRRVSAFRALWRAVSRRSGPGEPGTGERLRAMPDLVTDTVSGRYTDMGRGKLAVFGLGDDAIVAMWLGGALLVEADRYLGWRRARPTVVDGRLG